MLDARRRGCLHDRGEQAHVPGGAGRLGTDVVRTEQIEPEPDQRPARRRRRVGEDPRPSVAERQRLAFLHPVTRQIRRREVAPVRHVRDERCGDLAAIEQVHALDGDRFEGVGEHGVRGPFAGPRDAVRRLGAREDREGRLARADDGLHHALQVRLHRAHLDTVERVPARRRHQLAQRNRAEIGVDFGNAPHHPRSRDRAPADVELLPRRTEVRHHRIELDVFRRPAAAWRLHEEVVDPRPFSDRHREQEAATAGRREHRLGHEARRERRDDRVVRVAARAEDVLRGGDGQGMAGCYDAAHPRNSSQSRPTTRSNVSGAASIFAVEQYFRSGFTDDRYEAATGMTVAVPREVRWLRPMSWRS